MQRTYRERKYKCGDYMEVAIFPVYTKAKGRGKRKKPTTEIQARINRRHATDTLRRLLHTNFTAADLFVTLTFDDANLPALVEDAQRLLRHQRGFCKISSIWSNKFLHSLYNNIVEHRGATFPCDNTNLQTCLIRQIKTLT